ncbi:hypothetical protein [Williamsia muralis]
MTDYDVLIISTASVAAFPVGIQGRMRSVAAGGRYSLAGFT